MVIGFEGSSGKSSMMESFYDPESGVVAEKVPHYEDDKSGTPRFVEYRGKLYPTAEYMLLPLEEQIQIATRALEGLRQVVDARQSKIQQEWDMLRQASPKDVNRDVIDGHSASSGPDNGVAHVARTRLDEVDLAA